jgi:hypothetical protein
MAISLIRSELLDDYDIKHSEHGMATVMLSYLAGLFVGEEESEAIRDILLVAEA